MIAVMAVMAEFAVVKRCLRAKFDWIATRAA